MGKKARKTRWRALAIDNGGNQSDSEEANAIHADKGCYHNQSYSATAGGGHHYNGYQPSHYGGVQRSYRAGGGGGGGKYSFVAGQGGAPRGRFGHHPHHYGHAQHHYHQHAQSGPTTNDCRKDDDSKSTGQAGGGAPSADGKITFNEDEYTRITTPRQDVLFKKGYLSKPKTYQTQTSTGASTISTGNSTGNGTPDHQSADGTEGTDLEYESQFVFPNGFVDQNGIYYVNSFEPYPLVVYNPPMCYPEYVSSPRSKRLSTGSLTESTSPHNEETSQELSHSGGENVSYPEYGHSVYNLVFPGYYGYGVPPEMELSHGEPRKIKKRRRRKLSKPVPEGSWTTSSSDDYDESEEMVSEIENRIIQGTHRPPTADSPPSNNEDGSTASNDTKEGDKQQGVAEAQSEEQVKSKTEKHEVKVEGGGDGEDKTVEKEKLEVVKEDQVEVKVGESPVVQEATKKGLKADAKEFIPRYFHHQPHHRHPHPPFIANLIQLPPPFLHGPPHPQQLHMMPAPPPHLQAHVQQVAVPADIVAARASCHTQTHAHSQVQTRTTILNDVQAAVIPAAPQETTAQEPAQEPVQPRAPAAPQAVPSENVADAKPSPAALASPQTMGNKHIDIAKIVSKLEEAAKEQRRSGAPKMGNQRSRRNHARHFPVELSIDKRASIKVEAKSVSVSTSTCTTGINGAAGAQSAHGHYNNGAKNYAQMLSRKSTATSPMKKYSRSPAKDIAGAAAQSSGTPGTPVASQSASSLPNHGVQQTQSKTNASSQWISVQSRKKRKNRNQEYDWDDPEVEVDGTPGNEPKVRDDGFESYDVSKLEDVVVAKTPQEAEVVEDKTKDIDNKQVVPEIEEVIRVESRDDVQDIVIEEGVLVPVVSAADQKAAEEEEFDKLIRTLEELEAKTPQKRKTLNKVPNKRVMITDHGAEEVLPLIITEITDKDEKISKDLKAKKAKSKSKTKEVAQKAVEEAAVTPAISKKEDVVEAAAPEVVEAKPSESASEAAPVSVLENQKSVDESPEKKKKKKKKPSKKQSAASLTSDTPPPSVPTTPSTSASVDEASYNFLLTDSLLEEERTNLEVSEELDKLIQRGMFTSLEEKIKSLNITAMSSDDGFFKSMTSFADAPSKSAKEDDLTTILAKTTNIFKAKRPLCQHNAGQGGDATTSTGSFLDLASLHEDPGISTHGGRKDEYPITKAVKDWMVRTRETTPEIELLKSPRTILKEIGKGVESLPAGAGGVKESWSLSPESSFEDEDLLECWDDLEETTKITSKSPSPRDEDVEKQRQIEASLEVYESMYGKNEDFKQIKAEIEERKRNGTLPKHGGLPYRAVCCSVM